MKRIVSVLLFLIIVLIGCEKENSSNELRKVTIEAFLNAPESSDVWYQLTGEIESIEDEEYGDFTISDETASVYIYGMTKRKVSANDKSFSQLGLNVGDVVTLATRRASYNGKPQGGGNPDPAYYLTHSISENGDNSYDLYSLLANTSWKHVKTVYKSGEVAYANAEFTFNAEKYDNDNYYLDLNNYSKAGSWRATEDNYLLYRIFGYSDGQQYPWDNFFDKDYSIVSASWPNLVVDINNSQMILESTLYQSSIYFTKINSNGTDDNSGSNGSPSPEYEKPDVGFYDYTPDKTSVKVQYKIFNRDEAKVSSAKIYYGTSSNPTASKSATVSGVMITATLTGLKAGTQYYVKCVATGKGGTTTTSVTKVMTNY